MRTRDTHTPLKQYRVQWGQLARVSRVDRFMLMDARRHPGLLPSSLSSFGGQSEVCTEHRAKLQLV